MQHIKKPTFPTGAPALITSKHQFKKFDKEWKKIIAEDRARGDGSLFAPLMIFRNIVLGDSPFKGRLYSAINRNSNGHMDRLTLMLYRMMVEARGQFNLSLLSKHMINPSEFYMTGTGRYIDRVQEYLINEIEGGEFTRHKTIEKVFKEAEKSCMYNIIRESDLQSFLDNKDCKIKLKEFAKLWLSLEGRSNVEELIDCKIHENDSKHLKGIKSIFITTKMFNARTRQQHVLPLKLVWRAR